MKNFWGKYKFRIIGAALGTLFHLAVIGFVYSAEGSMLFLIFWFVDFPLTIIIVPLAKLLVYARSLHPILEWLAVVLGYYGFLVGGTLMYGLLGWFSGPFLKRQALARGLYVDNENTMTNVTKTEGEEK